ncbi:MAG: hypothetical protein IT437_05700 [Phycisphaerales bacterium]|nr:hypothetical protein [Phycisphaerales bacterium]
MGLEIAIDDLYATGWSGLDTTGCLYGIDGRSYPGPERVRQEFQAAGFGFTTRHVQLFNCYRAEWREAGGGAAGAVVGHTEAEAAVYALAQMRRTPAAEPA